MSLYLFDRLLEAASCAADLIFPLSCAACGAVIAKRHFPVCPGCRESILYFERGAKAFEDIRCSHVNGWFALGPYAGVLKKLIAAFKYHNKTALADFFAREAAGRFREFLAPYSFAGCDVLVPVPLHTSRIKERGFNQAELFAFALSALCGVGVCCDAVARVRETREQNRLHYRERFENLEGAFEINRKKIYETRLKNVIIVDDIITTGATVTSLAGVLKSHGALNIFALSIARTGPAPGRE